MLGSRIEEQERMIELVRKGACKRVLQELDKKAVRKMRPEQVSRLLSALIPFRSRPAREIEELVFRNGRWSWTEKDEEGFWLHEQIIRGGRVDMAAKAAERIRKREAGDSGLSFVWAELVVYLMDKCQRLPARNMLEKDFSLLRRRSHGRTAPEEDKGLSVSPADCGRQGGGV